MKRAFTTKAFTLFTLLFIAIAVCSFVVFRETEQVCAAAKTCSKVAPSHKSAEMLWDNFSSRFISLISVQ